MKKGVLVLLSLFPLVVAAHQGKVFIDKNHNGIYDQGEKGLEFVSVSDGLSVTQTDADGTYSLPGHTKERFIFITTPSGYKTANAYYQKISEGIKTYDFALQPYHGGIRKDGTHKFIHISDTEISETQGHEGWISNLRDYSANEGVAFIVHTGDICYRQGLDSHIQIMNSTNMPTTQVFYTIGNHDLVSGKYGEEHFEELYGPVFYSFEVGNVHYIVTPMSGGDYSPSYRTRDVYNWLKNDLKYVSQDKMIMVFNHSILNDMGAFKFGPDESEYIDLTKHNLKAWLYGHWHINHIHTHENGVRSICSSTPVRGGIDHAASAFRVLTVDSKGDFTSELRYCYLDKKVQIASLGNGLAPTLPSGAVPLSVNAYSSSTPVKSVAYTCLIGDRILMAGKKLKQQTDFNWYAEMSLPTQLDNQMITVKVNVCFANGEKAKTESSFVYKKQATTQLSRPDKDWTNLLISPQHIATVEDTLSVPLRLAWIRNIGSNIYMTSPLITQKAVFVASVDDNDSGRAAVASIDARSGRVLWKYPVRGSIRSSIATAQGLIFAQDVHGKLYAIDAEKGTLVWDRNLGVNMVPALNDGLIATDDVVYAGTGKSLCALKAVTGELIWKNSEWNRGEGCTATLSLNRNVLIGHAHWSGLYANDATTGKKLWGLGSNGLQHRSGSAAMHGDILYLISDESFFIIESKTGRVLIRKHLGYNVNVTSVPLVTDTEIVFGTGSRGVVALDRETLVEKWNFLTKPAMIYSAPYVRDPAATVETSPVLVGNTIFVGASDGAIYGINRKDGKQVWKHQTGAPVYGTVAVSGNMLYAVDFSGNVYGFVSTADLL